MSKSNQGCLGCLGLVVVVALISTLVDTNTSTNSSSGNSAPGTASTANARQMHAPQAINVRERPSIESAVAYTLNRRDITYVSRETLADGWAVVFSGPAGRDTAGFIKVSLLVDGPPPPLPNLELLDTKHEPASYGYGYATGRIRNNTSRTYGYVQVQINLIYNGTVVGSTMDNMNNLAPGEIWRFRAPILERFTTYRIEDVSGF